MISIKKELKKYRIDLKNQCIIAGISGGPDSMCLLHLLYNYGCDITACHVNYGLRGDDSDKDEKLVREFCQENNIKCNVLKYHGKKQDENTLRNFRYDFFKSTKPDFIAIAHNADDQTETILMNFIRGASLRGLGGMKFISESIIRPLLHVSRDDIMKYLKKYDIPYRIDKTNENNLFFRNKIRNELIPILNKYNPNISDTIRRNSEIFRDLQQFIDDYADLLLSSMGTHIKNGIEIDYKKWILLPMAIKNEVLKQAIIKIIGNSQDLQAKQIKETVEMLINKVPSGKKILLKNLSIEEKYGKIIVVHKVKSP